MPDYQKIEYFTRPGGTEQIVVKCSTAWEPLSSKKKEKHIKRARKMKFTLDMNNV